MRNWVFTSFSSNAWRLRCHRSLEPFATSTASVGTMATVELSAKIGS